MQLLGKCCLIIIEEYIYRILIKNLLVIPFNRFSYFITWHTSRQLEIGGFYVFKYLSIYVPFQKHLSVVHNLLNNVLCAYICCYIEIFEISEFFNLICLFPPHNWSRNAFIKQNICSLMLIQSKCNCISNNKKSLELSSYGYE